MQLNFKYVGHKDSYYVPHHATEGASGSDLRNATGKVITIHPGDAIMIPTGICVQIPDGFEGQLRPRSGLSVRHKLIMLPSVGTIDNDYTGEIKATFFNPTNKIVYLDPNERVAQLIVAPYLKCNYNKVEELTKTERGSGGFGSTNKI